MPCADLTRSYAAFCLAVVDWFTAPLRAMAPDPAMDPGEEQALQQEVWSEWGKQPSPLNVVIFA